MAAAGTLTTGKIAVNYIERMIDTFESQMQLVDMISSYVPPSSDMQNAGNVVWQDVQQHAYSFSGFDATGQHVGIITEQCPSYLGQPENILVNQQIDNVRDQRYWDRQAEAGGLRLASDLNRGIANTIANTGGIFYRTNAVTGFPAIAEAQTIMNERQKSVNMRYLLINDRDNLKYASELSNRQTIQGQPEKTWKTGQIGNNIAGFDIFNASFLPSLVGGTNPATTTTAAVSAKPEGGSVTGNNVVTNVDYRNSGTISVVATGSYNVNDSVSFANSGTPVYALGLDDKTNTTEPMTFKIVNIISATQVEVWPKPIALDDAALSNLEKRYANIDTQIGSGATMDRLNIDVLAKTNIFFDKDSIEVIGGLIPAQMLSEFQGMKIITKTLSNGLTLYFMYDANLTTLQVQFRAFIWYGITNLDPSNNGSFVTF